MPIVCSEKQTKYFEKIEKDVLKIYEFAEEARKIGVDPECTVECPPAKDMASRVEQLVGPTGIAEKIRQWKEEGADQDEICFRAMDLVIERKFGEGSNNELADLAIRVALAIKTEGVVSAPLEGISKVVIRDNKIGGDPYLSLYFAGPIRAAGGTVQAFAILCAEYVREKMNIAPWKATEEECERFVEEVKLYDRILNLQYPSTNEELSFAVSHLTIELNGDPTETQEVSAHRDLPRIDTNFVRGGPCLVLNDGLLLKSKKIQIIIDKRKITGWEWLKKLKKLGQIDQNKEENADEKDKSQDYGGDLYKGKNLEIQEEIKKKKLDTPVSKRKNMLEEKNPPLNKYIADVIAGRPVFAFPSEVGGQRIRYGRSRNTGLAACGIHPSQMFLLEKYMAIGTQIRIERPGKSSSVMPVTSIEPPIVLMKNGDVKQLWNIREAEKIAEKRNAKKILFVGDILFGYGEFAENNHIVLPSGYVEEWWSVELEEVIKKKIQNKKNPYEKLPPSISEEDINNMIKNPFKFIPTGRQALDLAINFNIGLHPRYLDHWGNINGVDLLKIREEFKESLQDLFSLQKINELNTIPIENLEEKLKDGILITNNPDIKQILEKAFVVHDNEETHLKIHRNRALIFIELFGFGKTAKNTNKIDAIAKNLTALELFTYLSTIKVNDKAPYYMGSRMGRPEKAKERTMKPPVQSLFPIGHDSKLQRSFQNASQAPSIKIDICQKKCPKCDAITFLNLCPKCGTHTEIQKICPVCKGLYEKEEIQCPKCQRYLLNSSVKKISFKTYFEKALKNIHKTIPKIKGVKGMTSEYKIPEPLEKGILRAINKVWVYKDGTIRADATDIPLTHFNCKEIKVSVEKIKELGYDIDIYGNPIVDNTQIIELKVQDVLLTEHLGDYFVRVSKFVDDELEYIYQKPRFYNITEKSQLIGHYMAGLAPHTSAAIIGRLIGFTQAESGYAHPYWHAAKRRNSDGDEDGIMLLLECLLNFSKYYLPSSLGGKMDAPLVISLLLDPLEVDSESHNVDYSSRYPLQFYLDSKKYVKPSEMKKYMDLFKNHLRTESQFEGSMFTHPTKSINMGPHKSAYTLFKTMNEKIESQLYLAKIISAVYEQEVARKVIGSHFAPDILGNLRAFSTQTFRCVKCGEKFRRIPLSGKCTKCKGKLLLTVTSGGIKKYLPKAQELIKEFNLGAYTEQRWQVIERYITSLCDNPKIKQQSIASFFK